MSDRLSEPAIVTPDDLALIPGAPLNPNARDRISAALRDYGCVLFRGFNLSTDKDFDKFIGGFGFENFRYDDSFSNAVRRNRTDRVFTANEAPPDVEIHLHHEMAQTLTFPTQLFFFCETAPTEGGATPICRSDLALKKLSTSNPDFVHALRRKGCAIATPCPQMRIEHQARDVPGTRR